MLIKRTETVIVTKETVETVSCGDNHVTTETSETTQHTNVEEHFVSEEDIVRGRAPVAKPRIGAAIIYLG